MDSAGAKLGVKIYADGADIRGIAALADNPLVKGFTTNPTLMRAAGVTGYYEFAREAITIAGARPISFEVFADDFPTMEQQALEIASWGENVNVKIPITNTKGESSAPLIGRLSEKGVTLNITAMFTLEQVREIVDVLDPQTPAILSIFAGRIADTGIDPIPVMCEALAIMKAKPKTELLWASPREVLNVVQADQIGCHIITITNDLIKKIPSLGKDLTAFSLDTVAMFYNDAQSAGYHIQISPVAA